MGTRDTDDANFEQDVLRSDKPVLVDFWATWCTPCKKVTPILEEIAEKHGDKLSILKLDTDQNPQVTQKYGITGVPTLNVYVDGEVVKSIVGVVPKQKLLRELEPYTS